MRRPSSLRRRLHRTAFRCPLCAEAGRAVTLVAELDTASPVVTVVDLRGCAHADTFGELDALTVGETWALIDAALSAFERRRRRP